MQTLCPQCGAPATNNSGKCEYCGAAIPVQPAYQQPVYQQPPQPAYQQPPQPAYQQPVYQQPVQPVYQQNVYYSQPNMNLPVKSKLVAILLAFFLGGLGIHRFYLGQSGAGVLMLLFCWTGIPSIIALIDFIALLCMNDQAFCSKYTCRLG
jgi:TM2 domain-containing membrane protein YozV